MQFHVSYQLGFHILCKTHVFYDMHQWGLHIVLVDGDVVFHCNKSMDCCQYAIDHFVFHFIDLISVYVDRWLIINFDYFY